MTDNVIRITPDLTIPASELSYRSSRSGGPGGQHVNTTSTRVELVWDVDSSPSLTNQQRERIKSKLSNRINSEGLLTMASSATRSQHRNREEVTERFTELLRQALDIPKVRKKTRPSRAAHERRLKQKRIRSERKRERRAIPPE